MPSRDASLQPRLVAPAAPVARVSDEDVFAAAYPALRRLAAVVGPPGGDPDDLVQEATARALRRGPLSELDQPTAYLRRTIVNLAANERRGLGRRRRALARLGAEAGVLAEYPSDVAELLRLAPGDRAVLWLADVERLPFEQVAELVGCTPDTARARASRARRHLRRLVEEDRS